MDEELKSIAPYSDEQVTEALKFLETDKTFYLGVKFFNPTWTDEIILKKLQDCDNCSDFMVTFIEMIIKDSISDTMDSFEIVGLEKIKTSNCFYISNHRDIFLDSALLQNHLWDLGKPFTEISLGDNLMVNPTMKAVAKLNSMYTVKRSSNRSEMMRNSINLSKYLRYSITTKNVASWIAQGNGRTKDGNDQTAQGLIKMLLLSGENSVKESIAELNLVVSTISFEYEPCAYEKANELHILAKEGKYEKQPMENMHSIVNGIKDYKGNVRLRFETLDVEKISFTGNRKKDILAIVDEIDRITYKNYALWKTNYMGYDLKNNSDKYKSHYTTQQLEKFKNYLNKMEIPEVYENMLDIYCNPVVNFEGLGG